MMVKAKITVFDDETGQVFVKDKVIEPYREEKNADDVYGCYLVSQEFRFEIKRLEYMRICLRCKYFSCSQPTQYSDDRVTEYCTLHPGNDDACGCCNDYEADL